jgi:hypothetical protein
VTAVLTAGVRRLRDLEESSDTVKLRSGPENSATEIQERSIKGSLPEKLCGESSQLGISTAGPSPREMRGWGAPGELKPRPAFRVHEPSCS